MIVACEALTNFYMFAMTIMRAEARPILVLKKGIVECWQ